MKRTPIAVCPTIEEARTVASRAAQDGSHIQIRRQAKGFVVVRREDR